jgi:CheY-like chemotaxis protein
MALPRNGRLSTEPEGHTPVEILVVDDDAILRDLVADWLEGAGYRVQKAENCSCAIGAAMTRAPALIVTDMFMPGACGVEAIAELKQAHPGIALIAVSGHFASGQGLSAEAAMSAGADRAFAKPVKRADLLRAIAELLGPPDQ